MHTPLAAAAYDILSDPDKRLAHEGAFLRQLAGTGKVLDLACATGVHAGFLARWGAKVTACDLDPAMITIAGTRRQHENIHYLVRDMRTPPAGEFDLVMCIGNSLNMLPAPADAAQTIAAAAKILAPGGRLLLHTLNPDSPARRQPTMITRTGMVDNRQILIIKAMQPHGNNRMISVAYFRQPGNNEDATSGAWESSCHATTLMDLTQSQVSGFLEQAGLLHVTWYGGLDGAEFVKDGSPDLVCVAAP